MVGKTVEYLVNILAIAGWVLLISVLVWPRLLTDILLLID